MIVKHSLKFISNPKIELARHEATQSTRLKSPKNAVKSRNTINTYTLLIHIIYIYKYIYIRENKRGEREREELARERRRLKERESERK